MRDLASLFLSPKASIRKTIRIIDQGGVQIALVVDAGQRLLGTVTDGDIRRGLLKGEKLDSPVERVMHRDFQTLSADCPESRAKLLMREKMLYQVPGLDEKGRVVWLFLQDKLLLPKTVPNWVVLMAGGQGHRMGALTEACPKPMLRVGNKPILEIILEQCIEVGFRKFFISVNYLKQQVIEHFGDGSHWGVEICYLEENRPLGTVGALALLPKPASKAFLVVNGDVLTRIDFKKLLNYHQEHKAVATVCVREHKTQVPFGVVHTEGPHVLSVEEKPEYIHHINAGIYVLEPSMLSLLPRKKPCDMPQLLSHGLEHDLPLFVYPIHEYWLDVGHPQSYEQANGEWNS